MSWRDHGPPILHNAAGGLVAIGALTVATYLLSHIPRVGKVVSLPIPLWSAGLLLSLFLLAIFALVARLKTVRQQTKKMGGETLQGQSHSRSVIDGNSGILSVFPELPIDQLVQEIAVARRFSILQTWSDNILALKPAIKKAAEAHARIQLLFIHPKSVMLKYRAREYQQGTFPAENLRKRVSDQIEEMKALRRDLGIPENSKHFEIHTYDATPVIALYRTENVSYIGVFWHTGSAMLCPQLKVKNAGYYHDWADKHFQSVWEDSIRA